MKVLFLSQRVPWPPDRGDRITTAHFLGHLLDRGDHVRVGCLAEDERDLEAAATVGQRVAAITAPRIHREARKLTSLRGLLTGEALTLPFFRSAALREAVRRWHAEDPFDLVYVYSSSMAQYGLDLDGPIKIMQFAELDSDKWRQYAARKTGLGRWIYSREARTLLAFEQRVARSFDASLVVSDVERDLFVEQIPGVEPVVMPNGVDVDHFASAGDHQRDPATMIFTGVMDYEPNVDGVLWFADECLPAIRERHTAARLLVVGSRPSREILDLGRRAAIEVTGRVPETPPYFDRAGVAIAPLRLARGVQNKVLEAMSMGLPVVSSPQAAQGLGEVPPETLLIADGREATIERCCELLADPTRARTIGANAGSWVREHFRWEHMFARLDRLLDQLAARR